MNFQNRFSRILKGLVAASALLASLPSQAIEITINFTGGLTASQQSIFTMAETFWENRLVGYLDPAFDAFFAGPTINAGGADIDGAGGILGQAGPTSYWVADNVLLNYNIAKDGAMEFDTADLALMEASGALLPVIVHEMAHVLGFGTMWELNGVYTPGTGQYTGLKALEYYQLEFDPLATYVPVELGGAPGTADGHWNEVDGGAGPTGIEHLFLGYDMMNELMTGWLNPGTSYISNTTLGSFEDIGYLVAYNIYNVATPSSLILLLVGFAGIRLRRMR